MTKQYLMTEFSTDALQRLAVIAGEGEVLHTIVLGAHGGCAHERLRIVAQFEGTVAFGTEWLPR